MNLTKSRETEPKTQREPLSWDEKLLIFAFPTLLCIAAIGQFALGRGAEPAQIQFPAPVALPVPNGFDVYLAAEAAIKLDVPAVDLIDDSPKLTPTDPKLAAQKYSLAKKDAWLKANAAGFALFKQAQTLPCRSPESALPLGSGGFRYASSRQLSQLGRYKIIEINAFTMRKNWNGAVTSALDALQMGIDIANGGSMSMKYYSAQIQTNARETLSGPVDPISKLSAAQARAAAKRLEAIVARRTGYAEILENSRWATLREFDYTSQQPNWQSQMLANSGRELTWREKLGLFADPRSQIIDDINHAFDHNIADLKKPLNAPLPGFTFQNPLSQNFVWVQSNWLDEARELTTLNVLLLRLALRAFEAENGRLPQKLSELSPRILAKIPTDAYADGAPFHFLWKGQKPRLYSVGPDGKDDGGKPLKEKYVGNSRSGRYNTTLDFGARGDYVAGINH
ncbi:hypothetical protein B1R32_13312 [Abditibacterium utsteinense]|uniref:Uncharacterized protein n=1 Tax=Abditibacterium utsteinense TaxID=1960156 RepID=A0A2S8SNV7_9BACT|nr:hypothetical protein [Abditibacterium utsteinense]PQV62469.1 hypothetical protein B1R32_13312 [Abditibacterium utsteinense]